MFAPLVSIIIPAYNVEKYIEQCVDSILNQTYCSIEIIIIDDGATDKTAQFLEKYSGQINLILNEDNKVQGVRRNEGIKKSKR